MPTASHLRAQIEATLAERIPSALTPMARLPYSVEPTGIPEIDHLLHGGFPVGALSEVVGPECSGRTSLALAFVAGITQAGKVCAWVDASDTLHPESAAAIGVDLSRLLWVRCGSSPVAAPSPQSTIHGLQMGEKRPKAKLEVPPAGGGHPRMEAKGLSAAVNDLLGPAKTASHNAQALPKPRPQGKDPLPAKLPTVAIKTAPRSKSWARLEQALRVTDLLLQAGGFSSIVLDMGSLSAEYVLRVPLATWFRFRTAAERLQSNVMLLTQHACTRNSAGLVLRLAPGSVLAPNSTIFTGLEYRAELTRQRFSQSPGNVYRMRSTAGSTARRDGQDRKQPQNVQTAMWQGRTVWAGRS
jgi:recombination protein RecA